MAEISIKIHSGPMAIAAVEESRHGGYQVTVVNQSNHNCTGGTISLRSTTGEIPQWQVPAIPMGQSSSHVFVLNGQPSIMGFDLISDVGQHWGPGAAAVSPASFPLTAPLQPF